MKRFGIVLCFILAAAMLSAYVRPWDILPGDVVVLGECVLAETVELEQQGVAFHLTGEEKYLAGADRNRIYMQGSGCFARVVAMVEAEMTFPPYKGERYPYFLVTMMSGPFATRTFWVSSAYLIAAYRP